MGMMGLGGLIAVIGGLMFVVICLKAMSGRKTAMKEQTALRVAVAAGVASLLTVGLLGYRLLNHTSPESVGRPPGLISAQTLTPEEAKVAVDAIFALNLPDLDGRPQPLAQWRGKVLVVNYWASWCKPCVDEMPALSRMNSHYAARGVQFVGIGLDDAEKLAAFVRTTPVSYPVLVASPAAGDAGPAGEGVAVHGGHRS